MTLRLISFAGCPFVERAKVALRERGIDHEVIDIDLRDQPDWFGALSPRGKVPVLDVDGTALFESGAILEYIEDAFPGPSLRPADVLQRAHDRAWFSFASEVLFSAMWAWMTAAHADAAEAAEEQIHGALRVLEPALDGRDWLSGTGAAFGFADVGFAPGLIRLHAFARHGWIALPDDLPNVLSWIDRISTRKAVMESYASDATDRLVSSLAATNGRVLGA